MICRVQHNLQRSDAPSRMEWGPALGLRAGDFGEDATSTHLPLDHLLVALRKRWRRGGCSRSGNVAPLSLGKDDTLSNVQNAPGSPIPKVHLAHEYQCSRFSKTYF
jgi:hypothetical protein